MRRAAATTPGARIRLSWARSVTNLAGGALLAAAVVTVLGTGSAAASGKQTSDGRHLYLPHVGTVRPEVCSPEPDAACGSGTGDRVHVLCGGFGRIRDLYGPARDGPLAVGDGAARLLGADALGSGPAWSPQTGDVLTGLNALSITTVSSVDCPHPPCGWSVGDHDGIARYRDGCLRPHSGGDNRRITLSAVDVTDAEEGWAVGRDDGPAGARAALRVLRRGGSGLEWFDAPSQAEDLPPLEDVQVFVDGLGQEISAWAVGSRAGRGHFVRGQIGARDYWEWTVAQTVGCCPRELTLADFGAYGWSFGSSRSDQGPSSLTSWRHAQPGTWWPDDFALPGRDLVDAYLVGRASEAPEVWVGASPGSGDDPVLYLVRKGEPEPEPVGPPLPSAVGGDADGNRAVAPLADGSVLYAWGDEVWMLDSSRTIWRRVRDRWRFVDVATTTAGAWLLAREGHSSSLFFYGPSGLLESGPPAGPGTVRSGGSAGVRGLGAGPMAVWAVGDAGLCLRATGATASWSVASPAGSLQGDLLDVIEVGGSAWASGVGADGVGRVWRLDSGEWREEARTSAPVRLVTLAATADGAVWAAGGDRLLRVDLSCVLAGRRDCSAEHVADADLSALAAVANDTVWATAGTHIVQADPRAIRSMGLYAADGTGVLRHGSRLTAIVAAADGGIWATADCCTGFEPPGREHAVVLRFADGVWEQVTTLNVPLAAMACDVGGGDHSAWAVGDWTTILVLR